MRQSTAEHACFAGIGFANMGCGICGCIVSAMSVDFEAASRKPVTLAAVLHRARTVLSDLVGVDAPDLAVFADREYQQGVRTSPGRRLDTAGLETTVIGGPIAPDENGLSDAVFFEIDTPATGDVVRLMVTDYQWGGSDDDRSALFSPDQTCVGATLATALALAVAQLADGEYVDEQVRGCAKQAATSPPSV